MLVWLVNRIMVANLGMKAGRSFSSFFFLPGAVFSIGLHSLICSRGRHFHSSRNKNRTE